MSTRPTIRISKIDGFCAWECVGDNAVGIGFCVGDAWGSWNVAKSYLSGNPHSSDVALFISPSISARLALPCPRTAVEAINAIIATAPGGPRPKPINYGSQNSFA